MNQRKKPHHIVKLFALILMAVVLPIHSNTTNTTTLRFGIIDVPPFGCEAQLYDFVCFQNQLIEELAQNLDYVIDAPVMPFPRVLESIKTGKIDYLITLENPSIDAYANKVMKIADLEMALFRHASDKSADRLKPWRLGVLRNAYYGTQLSKLAKMEPFTVLTLQQSVEMFSLGRLDGVVGPPALLIDLLKRQGITIEALWQPIIPWTIDIYLYCRNTQCDISKTQVIQDGLSNTTLERRSQLITDTIKLHGKYLDRATNR